MSSTMAAAVRKMRSSTGTRRPSMTINATAAAGEMPDGELAFDLQADDQKEDREQPVVDPQVQRHEERAFARDQAPALRPERLDARTERGVRERDREDRRDQQQHAGGRRPGREVERGSAYAVAERPQHGIRERSLVPRSVVAPAVDEKRGRE